MARIRYLKPEAAEDVKLAGASRDARLLYRDLWCHMDRKGLVEDEPRIIKKNVFPYDDDLTAARVSELIEELIKVDRLVRIEWRGLKLLYCPTFVKHQKFHKLEIPKYAISDAEIQASYKHPSSTQPETINALTSSAGNGQRVTGNGQLERGTAEPVGSHAITGMEACKKTWIETLTHFGQARTFILPVEEQAIFRAIQENKDSGIVETALYGARFEPAHEGWNPKDHVDITRALTKDREGKPRIQKFVGYGVQARAAATAKREREAILAQTRLEASVSPMDDMPEQSPERVREVMDKVFGRRS